MLSLRSFMFERVYLGPHVCPSAAGPARGAGDLRHARGRSVCRRGRRAERQDHRLRGRDDGSLRARVRRAPRGRVGSRGPDQGQQQRGCRRRGRHRRGGLDTHVASANLELSLHGPLPVPRRADAGLSVDPVDKLYYCFGCGKGGDVVRFVQESENVDFVGAIEWLADRFRVPLEYEETSPQQDAARRRRERLTALLDQATTYFERVLWETETGAPVRAYLSGRLGEQIARSSDSASPRGTGLVAKARERVSRPTRSGRRASRTSAATTTSRSA